MFGMEMVLKNMGIDPKEILENVEKFGQMVIELKNQMDRIEHKLDKALAEKLIAEISTDENERIDA